MHLSRPTFDGLRNAIYQSCGLVVGDDKEYLIRDRLEGVIERRGLKSFEELCDRLVRRVDEDLTAAVIDAVTTQETSFFRDRHVFDALAREIFPRLAAASRQPQRRVRILSAGVSTGQEAYSLAILAHEATLGEPDDATRNNAFSILGTDISAAAIQIAAAGVYDQREIARGISEGQAMRYFDTHETKYRVREPIRRFAEFRRANLAQSITHLGTFDLICCRNVMIYFDEPTRKQICRQFHQMLAEDGWLLLGAAENVYGISTDFVSMPLGEALIYRKS